MGVPITPINIRLILRRWWALLFAVLLLALPISVAAREYVPYEPGRHVYDQAGLLTPDQVTEFEGLLAEIQRYGGPAALYLQLRKTDIDATIRDGRDLMETWDLQSGPDARDGVVVFFNLEDNLKHGNYALIAGKTLLEGSLPQRELNRIRDDMRPILRDGDIVGGIRLGLEQIRNDLRDGPPPPPPPSRTRELADNLTDGALSPVNLFGIPLAALGGWLLWLKRPKRLRSAAYDTVLPTPPDDLAPALAGALAAGSVGDQLIAGTLLDLVARGAMVVEPDGKKKIRFRLLDDSIPRPGYEDAIWQALVEQANDEGVVEHKGIGKAQSKWGDVRKLITQELLDRGWFDPQAGANRTPYIIAGIILALVALVPIVLAAIAASVWGMIGGIALAMLSFTAFFIAMLVPNTTEEGEWVGKPWRGYQRYLRSAGKNMQAALDLDTAIPYAVALGAGTELNKRLKQASVEGYLPAWLLGVEGTPAGFADAGFYPMWIAFNSSVTPSGSASAGGGGGASGGSGGAGGSF